jgi:hypothetical protein
MRTAAVMCIAEMRDLDEEEEPEKVSAHRVRAVTRKKPLNFLSNTFTPNQKSKKFFASR